MSELQHPVQGLDGGPQRVPRGYDADKKVKGRKRVLMVDTQGDPLGVQVVSADVQDRDALHALALDLDRHPSLLLVWLDRAFAGDDPAAFLHVYGIAPAVGRHRRPPEFPVSPGAGRSSRRSVACSAIAACGSTTRRPMTRRAR